MTANYKIDSANEIRKFLWHELTMKGLFKETDYFSDNVNETIIPILPVQQVPEMNQFLNGKKHIIYDKTSMSYESNWLVCTEKMQFTLYAIDVAEINEMRNFLIDLFRRSDESARDINNFMDKDSKLRFHTIYMSDISPIAPSEEIQGFLAADVILDIKYSRDVDRSGRFA